MKEKENIKHIHNFFSFQIDEQKNTSGLKNKMRTRCEQIVMNQNLVEMYLIIKKIVSYLHECMHAR